MKKLLLLFLLSFPVLVFSQQFIIMNCNVSDNYRGYAKRNGDTLKYKALDPIPVKVPKNKCVLPKIVLNDNDFKEAFPNLDALPQENANEIEFYQYDSDGNVIK